MPDSRAVVQAKYHQIEDVDPTDELVLSLVRRLVAANAIGDTIEEKAADARQIMMALGVHPSQEDDYVFHTGPSAVQTAINDGGL